MATTEKGQLKERLAQLRRQREWLQAELRDYQNQLQSNQILIDALQAELQGVG